MPMPLLETDSIEAAEVPGRCHVTMAVLGRAKHIGAPHREAAPIIEGILQVTVHLEPTAPQEAEHQDIVLHHQEEVPEVTNLRVVQHPEAVATEALEAVVLEVAVVTEVLVAVREAVEASVDHQVQVGLLADAHLVVVLREEAAVEATDKHIHLV